MKIITKNERITIMLYTRNNSVSGKATTRSITVDRNGYTDEQIENELKDIISKFPIQNTAFDKPMSIGYKVGTHGKSFNGYNCSDIDVMKDFLVSELTK